jgi:hypothetical protein
MKVREKKWILVREHEGRYDAKSIVCDSKEEADDFAVKWGPKIYQVAEIELEREMTAREQLIEDLRFAAKHGGLPYSECQALLIKALKELEK